MISDKPMIIYQCRNCETKSEFNYSEAFEKIKEVKCCANPNPKILKQIIPETEKIYLQDLEKLYNEHYHIEDFYRFELGWATALSSTIEGEPLWIIFVGASGDSKSLQLEGLSKFYKFFRLHNLTSKTLVSGYKDKKEYPDLAPELDGKLVCIFDMAQILKLPPVEKAEVWAQLRDLYDGLAGKFSGSGARTNYKNLKVTLLAGSTPAIDSQILVHQDLGTRELIYRTCGYQDKHNLIQRIFKGKSQEEKIIKKKLQESINRFLSSREVKEIELSNEIEFEIEKMGLFIANFRAIGEFDQFTNELRNDVYPEEPTRITKQLTQLYRCLKALDDNYPDERALDILWRVARSSCSPLRLRVYDFLESNKNKEFSTSRIAQSTKLGKKTVMRECLMLQVLDLITCRWEETNQPEKHIYHWRFNPEAENFEPSPKISQGVVGGMYYYISGDGFIG